MGSAEPALAFATRTYEPPALEIRVNFGLFAGREATPAEIETLGGELQDRVTELTIVAEERHELSEHSEASVHQVRIEVSGEDLPPDERQLDELRGRLIEIAERWAERCVSDRHIEPADL
jgi:hypothetical protein